MILMKSAALCGLFNGVYEVHSVISSMYDVKQCRSRCSHNEVKTDVSTVYNVCEMLAEEVSY